MNWRAAFLATFVALMAPIALLNLSCAPSTSLLRAQADGARADIERMVAAQYTAIERGDLREWGAAFASDVLLLGSDPSEVMLGRDALIERMLRAAAGRMASAVKRTYRSKRLRISLMPDGKSGWIADEIEYKLTSAETQKTTTFRVSEVVAQRDGRWQILVAHYSVPVADARAFSTQWPAPAEIAAQLPAGTQTLAALFPSEKLDHFPGRFAEREDALLIGTASEEWIEGRGLAARAASAQPSRIEVRRRGEVRMGLASSALAWTAWNATLTVPSDTTGTGPQRIALPVRVLGVFVRAGSEWQKVQEHVSIAVPD